MDKLTSEQLRKVDAAVAKAMGLELLDVGYRGTDGESKRQAELTEWMQKVSMQSVGEYWIDVSRDWWIEVFEWEPTVSYESWTAVEGWMVDKFSRLAKAKYTAALFELVHGEYESYVQVDEDLFQMLTAPLPLRCMAFLRALGVNVEELLEG